MEEGSSETAGLMAGASAVVRTGGGGDSVVAVGGQWGRTTRKKRGGQMKKMAVEGRGSMVASYRPLTGPIRFASEDTSTVLTNRDGDHNHKHCTLIVVNTHCCIVVWLHAASIVGHLIGRFGPIGSTPPWIYLGRAQLASPSTGHNWFVVCSSAGGAGRYLQSQSLDSGLASRLREQ